ncbi:hypothetical protein ONZ45_g5524 [Pleurotus djamor]|nr:hypothetical protein ONZ45_g5524 [Pleurotus djamor]
MFAKASASVPRRPTQSLLIAPRKVIAPLPKVTSRSSVDEAAPELRQGHCPLAAKLIEDLEEKIEHLPKNTPVADNTHPFAQFAGDLSGSVPHGEDAWEVWDPALNAVLRQQSTESMRGMVQVGEYGLAALCGLLRFLVYDQHVMGGLIEGKVGRLMEVIDDITEHGEVPTKASSAALRGRSVISEEPEIMILSDDESREESAYVKRNEKANLPTNPPLSFIRCPGVQVEMPEGKTPHTTYPFALHAELASVNWSYSVINGELVLYGVKCTGVVQRDKPCKSCKALEESSLLAGIVDRMKEGVHANSRLAYHGIGDLMEIARARSIQNERLRLEGLNNAQRLVRKATVLDLHKSLVMAVGSGKVERVERVLMAGLKAGRGVAGLIDLCNRAADNVYKPRNISEQDLHRGLLLWRMGGGRVAEFGHRSLGLPSISSLSKHTLVPKLTASVGYPVPKDIETNISACFSPIDNILKGEEDVIVHQVLMFDELKVEGRFSRGILEYKSKSKPELAIQRLKKKDTHLASEATVGALGLLSGDTRIYSARPILVSGSCKRETGMAQAQLINTCLIESQKRYRVISIASDGESRRGEALVQLTFSKTLSPESPIYPLLAPLKFMNLEVGEDDIIADKDYKHVLKRGRNLVLRAKGFKIHGVQIYQGQVRAHLRANKVDSTRIEYLLKPDDKQDVKVAYQLLHAISILPPPAPTDDATSTNVRQALNTLGRLFFHLTMPYTCIDLSLKDQLVHLSAAAHILLALLREDNAGSLLMPIQLYTDIMIMIKNAYFCVAKTQVDNPKGKFWLVLLGTDRLEVLFGILRTMVGNDANLDVLQLVLRLTGTTEVSTILAKHPEWDRSPRRLQLPALSRENLQVHQGVDHINPASWRGDVHVADVVLDSCWTLGRDLVKKSIPRLHAVLEGLATDPLAAKIDILRPFGQDLVGTRRLDETDDTAEDFGIAPAPDNPSDVNLDFEEAIAEELTSAPHDTTFDDGGIKVYKSRYLNALFREHTNPVPGSFDRTKRVAGVARHVVKSDDAQGEGIAEEEDDVVLQLDAPIISLIQCQGRLFVCVGEVNDLILNQKHHERLPLKYLKSPHSAVSYQLLYLVRASTDDDPTEKMDWRWAFRRGATYKVPGDLVEPINPQTTTITPGKPFYLFESHALITIGRLVFERVDASDLKKLPDIQPTPDFPYQDEHLQACFACEDPKKEEELLKSQNCPRCDPPHPMPTVGLSVLDHMAAHILFDKDVKGTIEPCGLCLQPRGRCLIYLKKGKGAQTSDQVDKDLSTCPNLVNFSYGPASISSVQHPSSNVPLRCPDCATKGKLVPAIWKYNMDKHYEHEHAWVDTEKLRETWKIDAAERADLQELWKRRRDTKVTRKGKKGKKELLISQRYSTRGVPRDGDTTENEEDSGSLIENGCDEHEFEDVEGRVVLGDDVLDDGHLPTPIEEQEVEDGEAESQKDDNVVGGKLKDTEVRQDESSDLGSEGKALVAAPPPSLLQRHSTYNDNPFSEETVLRRGSRRSRQSKKLEAINDCTGCGRRVSAEELEEGVNIIEFPP